MTAVIPFSLAVGLVIGFLQSLLQLSWEFIVAILAHRFLVKLEKLGPARTHSRM
jgi:hypothetical protein